MTLRSFPCCFALVCVIACEKDKIQITEVDCDPPLMTGILLLLLLTQCLQGHSYACFQVRLDVPRNVLCILDFLGWLVGRPEMLLLQHHGQRSSNIYWPVILFQWVGAHCSLRFLFWAGRSRTWCGLLLLNSIHLKLWHVTHSEVLFCSARL